MKRDEAFFSVSVRTLRQLQAVRGQIKEDGAGRLARLILSADLFFSEPSARALLEEIRGGFLDRSAPECLLALPPVLRAQDAPFLEKLCGAAKDLDGCLIPNLEALGFCQERGCFGKLYADAGFYLWNGAALSLWGDTFAGACLPIEYNAREQKDLIRNTKQADFFWEKLIYGYLPMMVTANCVAKTFGNCRGQHQGQEQEILSLRDRLGNAFPVLLDCGHCMNLIYNHVPLSLHGKLAQWANRAVLRLQFTIEDREETQRILTFFRNQNTQGKEAQDLPFLQYTTGHEKRGVQ